MTKLSLVNLENHSYYRALEYWFRRHNMFDISDDIRDSFLFSNFSEYNGLWFVLKFSISNNGQFALIKARKNKYGPASTWHYAFFYDLHEDLLIGVRGLGGPEYDPDVDPDIHPDVDQNDPDIVDNDSFYNGLRHQDLFAQRGGKKNIKKKTKISKKTNRKSKKRGKNSKKRRRTRKH